MHGPSIGATIAGSASLGGHCRLEWHGRIGRWSVRGREWREWQAEERSSIPARCGDEGDAAPCSDPGDLLTPIVRQRADGW